MEVKCCLQIPQNLVSRVPCLRFSLFHSSTLNFSDLIPALYDIWICGDKFAEDLDNELRRLMQEKEEVPLFLNEFFNIKTYNKTAGNVQFAVGHIINAITSVVNEKGATLPKYLVVILDHDIIRDIDDVFTTDAPHAIATLTDWTVHQINLIIHRKWVDLLDKKPGSLSGLCLHQDVKAHWFLSTWVKTSRNFQSQSQIQQLAE